MIPNWQDLGESLFLYACRKGLLTQEEKAYLITEHLEVYRGVPLTAHKYPLTLPGVLAFFTPAERLEEFTSNEMLAGLTPEERIKGLTPEQVLSALDQERLEKLIELCKAPCE